MQKVQKQKLALEKARTCPLRNVAICLVKFGDFLTTIKSSVLERTELVVEEYAGKVSFTSFGLSFGSIIQILPR